MSAEAFNLGEVNQTQEQNKNIGNPDTYSKQYKEAINTVVAQEKIDDSQSSVKGKIQNIICAGAFAFGCSLNYANAGKITGGNNHIQYNQQGKAYETQIGAEYLNENVVGKLSFALLYAGATMGTKIEVRQGSELQQYLLTQGFKFGDGNTLKLSTGLLKVIEDLNFGGTVGNQEMGLSQQAFGLEYTKHFSSLNLGADIKYYNVADQEIRVNDMMAKYNGGQNLEALLKTEFGADDWKIQLYYGIEQLTNKAFGTTAKETLNNTVSGINFKSYVGDNGKFVIGGQTGYEDSAHMRYEHNLGKNASFYVGAEHINDMRGFPGDETKITAGINMKFGEGDSIPRSPLYRSNQFNRLNFSGLNSNVSDTHINAGKLYTVNESVEESNESLISAFSCTGSYLSVDQSKLETEKKISIVGNSAGGSGIDCGVTLAPGYTMDPNPLSIPSQSSGTNETISLSVKDADGNVVETYSVDVAWELPTSSISVNADYKTSYSINLADYNIDCSAGGCSVVDTTGDTLGDNVTPKYITSISGNTFTVTVPEGYDGDFAGYIQLSNGDRVNISVDNINNL